MQHPLGILPLDQIKRVAVYCLSGLGNILLFLPALRELRSRLPDAEIDFITIRTANFDLIKECPFVRPVLLEQASYNSPFSNLSVLAQCWGLRKNRYDLSLPVFPSNRYQYNVVAAILGAKFRLTHEYPKRRVGTLAFLQNYFVPVDESLHDIEQNLRLLLAFPEERREPHEPNLEFWTHEHHRKKAKKLFELIHRPSKPLIAFHPVSFPDMLYKRWPPEYFAETIDALDAELSPTQVLLGSSSDQEELSELKELCESSPHIICNEDLLTVGELLRLTDLMISNDSGLMHLAAAAHTPTLGLFGPTRHHRTRPRGKNSRFLESFHPMLPCRFYPFGPNKYPNCCGGDACMRSLTPPIVIETAKAMLRESFTGQA